MDVDFAVDLSGSAPPPKADLITTTHTIDATTPLNTIIVQGPGQIISIRQQTGPRVQPGSNDFRTAFSIVDGLPDTRGYFVPLALHTDFPGMGVWSNMWQIMPGGANAIWLPPEQVSFPVPYRRGIVLVSLPPGSTYTIISNP